MLNVMHVGHRTLTVLEILGENSDCSRDPGGEFWMIWIICPKFWPVVACEALAHASCVANKSTQTTCTDLSAQYVLLWPPFYRDKLSAVTPSNVSPFE